MSCHSCGPGAAERKHAKAMAKEMKKELTENIQQKMKRDLEERLAIKRPVLQNTRIWRRRHGLTQVDLALLADVSLALIRQYEQGYRPVRRLAAAEKIQRAIKRYPVRDDPIVNCCSGLRGMIDRGWVKARKGTGMLDPDRLYFLIELRGTETNIILHHCLTCGEDLYPTRSPTKDKSGAARRKND